MMLSRSIATAACVLLVFVIPAAADEVPQAVKDACKGDYETHCVAHEAESPAARECMARAFEKLSEGCVTAILDSPLAEQAAQDLAHTKDSAPAAADSTAEPSKPVAAAVHMQKQGVARSISSAGKTRSAQVKPPRPSKSAAQRPVSKTRVAHGRPQKRVSRAAASAKTSKRYAQKRRASPRSVASYIKRGTGIANYYVAKYTRFAFR